MLLLAQLYSTRVHTSRARLPVNVRLGFVTFGSVYSKLYSRTAEQRGQSAREQKPKSKLHSTVSTRQERNANRNRTPVATV